MLIPNRATSAASLLALVLVASACAGSAEETTVSVGDGEVAETTTTGAASEPNATSSTTSPPGSETAPTEQTEPAEQAEPAAAEADPTNPLYGEFATLGGESIDLGDLQGTDVVLWFWAPW